MIETILSVIGVIAGWMTAWFLGYSVGKKDSNPVKKMKLKDGSEIHIWCGFIDHDSIYMFHNTTKNKDFFDGDGVVFNKEGHITFIKRNER